MEKHQVVLQRAIGEILAKLEKEDREFLEQYMEMLERHTFKYSVKDKKVVDVEFAAPKIK